MTFLHVQKKSWLTKLLVIVWIIGLSSSAQLAASITDSQTMQMDANGNMVTIWREYVDADGIFCIKGATKTKLASEWTTPAVLSDPANNAYSPMLAVDSAGNAIALWLSDFLVNNVPNRGLFSAQLPFGGSWSSISSVSTTTQCVFNNSILVVDAAGDFGTIWRGFDIITNTSNIYSSTTTIGANWSTPLQVSQ